jgi:hypothetical protein
MHYYAMLYYTRKHLQHVGETAAFTPTLYSQIGIVLLLARSAGAFPETRSQWSACGAFTPLLCMYDSSQLSSRRFSAAKCKRNSHACLSARDCNLGGRCPAVCASTHHVMVIHGQVCAQVTSIYLYGMFIYEYSFRCMDIGLCCKCIN